MPKVEELINSNANAAKFLQEMIDDKVCEITDDIEDCLEKIAKRDEQK